MRVLLCGGGSAGHVNPALAIGETILRNSPRSQVAYVATIAGIENRLVDFKKYHIDVKGFKRKVCFSNIKNTILLFDAVKKSKEIIKEFCPDIIVGTGGYATYPVVYAGHKMGIKTVLHESNVCPGKAIKMLENKTNLIFTNFAESKAYFKNKEKIIRVGNPLRNGFEIYDKIKIKSEQKINEKFVILCYGGSLGAEKINTCAIEIIENYIRYQENIRFIWATGNRTYHEIMDTLKEKRLNKLKNLSVYEYIYDMPKKMAMADIIISRAGAMTISELAAAKKCSILIPSPNVTNNHQLKNAKALEKDGSAILITEDKTYMLVDVIKDLINNEKKRKKMENEINKFYLPDANKDIYVKILKLLQK